MCGHRRTYLEQRHISSSLQKQNPCSGTMQSPAETVDLTEIYALTWPLFIEIPLDDIDFG